MLTILKRFLHTAIIRMHDFRVEISHRAIKEIQQHEMLLRSQGHRVHILLPYLTLKVNRERVVQNIKLVATV